jgi:ABC-2 type transport system permease protein
MSKHALPSAISAEFLKLRTVRSPWLLLGAAQLIVVAGVSGLVMSSKATDLPLAETQTQALAHVGLVSILTLVFGVLAVAGEYRHKTVTDTYLSAPDRRSPVIAKLFVYSLIGALTGVVASAVAFGAVAAWWSAKGVSFDYSAAGAWTTLGGGVASDALFAAIGVGLGALMPNLTGAIAVALGWMALVEGILTQLIGTGAARWLPFTAGRALALAVGAGSSDLLPRLGGGLVLAGYAAAFAAIAVTTTLKRDVT